MFSKKRALGSLLASPNRASLAANGTTLTVIYDAALVLNTGEDETQYELVDSAIAVDSVSTVAGPTQTLELADPVGIGVVFGLSYTAAGSPLECSSPTDPSRQAPDYVNFPVTNLSTQDVTVPTKVSITVPAAGDVVVMTYSEALDEASVPAASDCDLDGTSATLDDPAVIDGVTVTWPVTGGTILQGETVTFDYVAGVNPIRDVAHNNAANLTAAAVTNGSTETAPTLLSAVLAADGLSLLLTFSEPVTCAGGGDNPWYVAFDLAGQDLEFQCTGSFVMAASTTLSVAFPASIRIGTNLAHPLTLFFYGDDSDPFLDGGGNRYFPDWAASQTSITNSSAYTDSTKPAPVSASIDADGMLVRIICSEACQANSLTAGDWTLGGTSSVVASASAGFNGTDGRVYLVPDAPIFASQTVTASFTRTGNHVSDFNAQTMNNFSNQAITNGSTVVATYVSSVTTTTTKITLTYAAPLDAASGTTLAQWAFTGSVTGAQTPSAKTVSGSTCALDFALPWVPGETITFGYTAGAVPLQDGADNDVANLVAQSVTNNLL